jgi:hypothetical protein
VNCWLEKRVPYMIKHGKTKHTSKYREWGRWTKRQNEAEEDEEVEVVVARLVYIQNHDDENAVRRQIKPNNEKKKGGLCVME